MTSTPELDPKPETVSRRGAMETVFRWFVGLGVAAFGGVAALWSAATWRFMYNNVPVQPALRFKVGLPADYPPGTVETKFKEQFGIWLVNSQYDGRQEIFALSTVCTHLGCITMWQATDQTFKCPCHGSGFTIDGINFEGPAPRPLERYAIRIADDGQLEVDRGRTFQQQLGQWNDPDSFVAAEV